MSYTLYKISWFWTYIKTTLNTIIFWSWNVCIVWIFHINHRHGMCFRVSSVFVLSILFWFPQRTHYFWLVFYLWNKTTADICFTHFSDNKVKWLTYVSGSCEKFKLFHIWVPQDMFLKVQILVFNFQSLKCSN
jgi:hypothetical protein